MSRKRKHRRSATEKAENWAPRPETGRDRPTPERRSRGNWALLDTERAGVRCARDTAAHVIDALEQAEVITNTQASAGRDYEQLHRNAQQVGGQRDSTRTWEPKGYESDDGPVEAVRAYRALCRDLGMIQTNLLDRVCAYQQHPKAREVEALRAALDAAADFFKK